jgi:hypothetical protein
MLARVSDNAGAVGSPGARLAGVVAAFGSPLFVLAAVWIAATACLRYAPAAFPVVVVVALLLWVGSIYLVARVIHRLLWRDRVTDAGPWGKALLTGLLTVLWFGAIAQTLALVFPTYFKRPPSAAAPSQPCGRGSCAAGAG